MLKETSRKGRLGRCFGLFFLVFIAAIIFVYYQYSYINVNTRAINYFKTSQNRNSLTENSTSKGMEVISVNEKNALQITTVPVLVKNKIEVNETYDEPKIQHTPGSSPLPKLILKEHNIIIKNSSNPVHDTNCSRKLPEEKMHPDKNIFFIVEYLTNVDMFLNSRQACAIESAAFHNPKRNIIVLVIDPKSTTSPNPHGHTENLLMQTLKENYLNIDIICITVDEIANGTFVYQWFKSGKLFETNYLVNNISNFLRFIILLKYGGTYMDSDVISLRSLDSLGANYAAIELGNVVNTAFMNFKHDNVGKLLLTIIITDMTDHYEGNKWGRQGPNLITRVLRKICNTNRTKEMSREQCDGFQVYPTEVVYAVGYSNPRAFFLEEFLEKSMKKLTNSTAMHLWNFITKKYVVDKTKKVLLNEIGRKHCPKIFAIKTIDSL